MTVRKADRVTIHYADGEVAEYADIIANEYNASRSGEPDNNFVALICHESHLVREG